MPFVLAPIGQLPDLTYEGFKSPRARWESLDGWKRRANSAHLNGFEILPGFIAAIFVAQQTGVPQSTIDMLALTFVVTRVLHASFYIANFAILRTISWVLGVGCIITLFVIGV